MYFKSIISLCNPKYDACENFTEALTPTYDVTYIYRLESFGHKSTPPDRLRYTLSGNVIVLWYVLDVCHVICKS